MRQAEYGEHGQRENQYNNQQVLDLGHQVNAEVVQNEECCTNDQSDHLFTAARRKQSDCILSEGQSVHCQGHVGDEVYYRVVTSPLVTGEDSHLSVHTASHTDTRGDEDGREEGAHGEYGGQHERQVSRTTGHSDSNAHHGHDTGADDLADRDTHQFLLTKGTSKVLGRGSYGRFFLCRHKRNLRVCFGMSARRP